MKTAAALLSLLLFASCKEGWTDENKEGYKKSCLLSTAEWSATPAQAESYCNCSLEQVMKHYATIEEVLENKDSVQLHTELDACRQAAMTAP